MSPPSWLVCLKTAFTFTCRELLAVVVVFIDTYGSRLTHESVLISVHNDWHFSAVLYQWGERHEICTRLRKRWHDKCLPIAWVNESWWRHQMETVFALLALCEGNPQEIGGFPSQKASNVGFDVFFEVHLNKRINKQSSRRWFHTPGLSLRRHCNVITWLITYDFCCITKPHYDDLMDKPLRNIQWKYGFWIPDNLLRIIVFSTEPTERHV